MDFNNYVRLRKAERFIRNQCDGDLFADAPLGTAGQELRAIELWLDLPRDLRTPDTVRLCKAAARTEVRR